MQAELSNSTQSLAPAAKSTSRPAHLMASHLDTADVLKKREEFAVSLRKKKSRDIINLKRKKMAKIIMEGE